MSTDQRPHFVVLRQEHIGNLSTCISYSDLDAACCAAQQRTISDSEPRYVVQVLVQVQRDPQPHAIVTPVSAMEEAA